MAQGSVGAGIVDSSQQSILPAREDSVTGRQGDNKNKMILKLDIKGMNSRSFVVSRWPERQRFEKAVLVAGGKKGQQGGQNNQDDEATASDSCMENRVDGEPSGTSLLQSRNASNDHLADFSASRMGGTRKPSTRAGSISIKLLLDEGIIAPGKGVLHMEYKGVAHTADLTEDGKIKVNIDRNHLVFDSPSAFSIYLKRLVNPTRKADDGWKSVRYNGNFLEHYKLELARKMFGLDSPGFGDDALLSRRNKRQKPIIGDAEPPPSPPRAPRSRQPFSIGIGADTREYLVPVKEYSVDNCQPFQLRIAPMAEAVIDFHSHLCHNEVTGVLLGTFDKETNTVNILIAIPMEANDKDTVAKVEMNDDGLVKKIQKFQTKDAEIQMMGSYHSHPDFDPRPTIIDTLYATREAVGSSHPCIQCIVSPYNQDAPTEDVASATWYHMSIPSAVESIPDTVPPESLGCLPYRLSYQAYTGDKVDVDDIASLQKSIEQLAKMYAPSPHRVNIEGLWRKTEDGQVVLRLRKLIRSFEAKLSHGPFHGKLRNFASFKLEILVRAVWSVYGRRQTDATPSLNATLEETSRGPKSVMMSNQNSESHAGLSSMQENGSEPGSEDEPISDDDEKTE